MRRLFCVLLLAAVSVAGAFAATMSGEGYRWDAGRFAVPLEIKDNAGVPRRQWPVRSGVPLPQGLVDDVSKLRLVDDEGREIPSQIGVTTRWWGRDDSVRWALLDFAIDLPANGRRQVWLTNDAPAAPVADPIRIDEGDEAIVVSTGGLRASVSRRTGQLLEAVEIDGTPVIAAKREDGPVLRVGAVQDVVTGPLRQGAAVMEGLKAALAFFAARRDREHDRGRDRDSRDEDDDENLFIG